MSYSSAPINPPHDDFDPAREPLRILRFALKRRRRGKIARLPEAVREQINLMLQDGISYAEIVVGLGEHGKALNKDNLSRWRKTNHQDWLLDQLWARSVRQDPRLQAHKPVEQICRLITEFDPETITETLSRDPSKYIPLLKALGRLADVASTAP